MNTRAARLPNTRRRATAALILLLALVALWLVLVAAGGAPAPPIAGLPDPGPLTGWALPIVRLAADATAVATVAALLVPVLVADRMSDGLSAESARAVYSVRRTALLWAILALVELALTYSDQFAVPVDQIDWPSLDGFARGVDQGQALLVQSTLATVVALGSRWLVTTREVMWWLAIAAAALVPPLLTGHSAASGSHDTAVVSLVVHVLAVSFWIGGVIALWWFLTGAAKVRVRAGRRFSGLAAWCFAITAVSGVVNALVRLGGFAGFVTSDYGRAALVKILVLAGLGLVAARTRASLLAGTAEEKRIAPRLGALTALELGLMSVAVALGVGLGRTPPPVGEIYTTAGEGLLGGPIPPAPTLGRLLWSFTPSGVGLVSVGLGGAAYAVGVVVLRRRGVRWPWGRSGCWVVGLALLGYATLGGLGTYSHVMFSAHMAAHMVLSMLAPAFLVLGAPVTLALRALPGADVPGGQGPRQWLAGALRSRPIRLLTHPVVVAVLFVGSLYAIYLTGWFNSLMENHLGHAFMEAHFLLVGTLFFETLIGSAPLPHRLHHLGRVFLLLVVMAFHAFFAVAVMSSNQIIGGDYYSLLDRGYATDLLADQTVGGALTWGLGEVPMVLVLVVIVGQWYRADSREARRHDRRADRDGDADLAAYNAMLSRLNQADRTK